MRLAGEILGHLRAIQANIVGITKENSADIYWVSDLEILSAFRKIEIAF